MMGVAVVVVLHIACNLCFWRGSLTALYSLEVGLVGYTYPLNSFFQKLRFPIMSSVLTLINRMARLNVNTDILLKLVLLFLHKHPCLSNFGTKPF
jgi:hypothetical protein